MHQPRVLPPPREPSYAARFRETAYERFTNTFYLYSVLSPDGPAAAVEAVEEHGEAASAERQQPGATRPKSRSPTPKSMA